MSPRTQRDIVITCFFIFIILSSLAYFSISMVLARRAEAQLRAEAYELHRGARLDRDELRHRLDIILKEIQSLKHQ